MTRNARWLEAVRSLDCCVLCGAHGVQAAHRNEGKGMGLKAPDHLTAALCPDCHHEIDNGKSLNRDARRALADRAIVLTFDALVRGGWIGVLA